MTFPSSLFIQFIEQGIKERLVLDITRTLDGEYYLDETYIAKTISKHVEAKGKISVETLASLLNLEQDTITCLIQKISLDKKWSFVDDLVLTQAYVNDAAKQVQMVLNKTGIISIVSQSQSMKLPYSLLKSIVFGLKGYVQYSVLPDTLMTEEYRINNKLKIQEALRAIEEPFPLFKVQKSLYILEDIFYLWVDEVMKENALGFLRGKRSRAIFEPKEYKEQQLNFIKSIFDSNGFVSFDGIENLYSFVNPVDLIKDNYKSDTYYILNSCVIKTHIKDNTRDMIQSMNDYCDVNDLLPSSLTLEDVNKVIDLCVQELASVQKIITLEGGYVTTPEYAQSLVDGSKHYLNNLSHRIKQKEHKNTYNSPIRLQESEMMKALESVGCPYHISEKILPFIRKSLSLQFNDMMQTPYVVQVKMEGDDWVTQQKEREYRTLTSMRNSIYFNYQSICLFEDEAARKSLEKYVLKSQCVEFLYHLVLYIILDQSFSQAEVEKSTSLCIPAEDITKQSITDTKQQKCVISYFIRENDHKYDKTSVLEVDELLKKKKLKSFVNLYLVPQNLFKETSLIDNNEARSQANKAVYHQLYKQLEQVSVSIESAPQILHLVSLLLFLKHYQYPLYVSGKFVPVIINQLEKRLSDQEKTLVNISHDSIVKNERESHIQDYQQLVTLGLNGSI